MRSDHETNRGSWNHGRIIGPKPPLKPKHIWAIRTRLQHEGRVRDLAINAAIDSKLRGCDLVRLRVSDIHLGDSIRLRTTIVQQKTGRPRAIRADRTDPGGARVLAPCSWATRKRLALPQPEPPRRSPNYASVRPIAGRLGCADRARSGRLRYPQPASDEGCARVQADRQPASLPTSAGPHEAGEHGALSRDRGRRRPRPLRADGPLKNPRRLLSRRDNARIGSGRKRLNPSCAARVRFRAGTWSLRLARLGPPRKELARKASICPACFADVQ